MTSETVPPRLLKSNVDLYNKILKRPLVNEKVLSRPPFKFLHDLVTLIVKNNGYLRGLYTEDQFQIENISSKEAKIVFLDRLIDAVGFIYGKAVDVKAAKIVAGLEVAKTNKLLNDLAKAITDRKPFLSAVDNVRKGNKPPGSGSENATPATTASSTTAKPGVKKAPVGANTKPVPTNRSTVPNRQTTKPVNQNQTTKGSTSSTLNQNKNAKTQQNVKKTVPVTKKEDEKPEPEPKIEPEPEVEPEPEPQPEERNLEAELEIETTAETKTIKEDKIDDRPRTQDKGKITDLEDSPEIPSVDSLQEPTLQPEEPKPIPQPEEIPQDTEPEKVVEPEPRKQSSRPRTNRPETNKRQRTSRPAPTTVTSQTSIENDRNPVVPLRSARPGSSRPAPPRVMTASRSRLQRMLDNRMASASQNRSPSAWPPPEGLKLNVDLDDDDETPKNEPSTGDDFTMSAAKLQEALFSSDTAPSESALQESSTDPKGKLMQRLLANKSELEGTSTDSTVLTTESDRLTDTESLRKNVREMCQSVATLTKAINYLHEDIDPMVSELGRWRTEYRTNLTQIESLRNETEKELEPLRQELESVEKEIIQMKDKLLNAKSNVYRNSHAISKLIESI